MSPNGAKGAWKQPNRQPSLRTCCQRSLEAAKLAIFFESGGDVAKRRQRSLEVAKLVIFFESAGDVAKRRQRSFEAAKMAIFFENLLQKELGSSQAGNLL